MIFGSVILEVAAGLMLVFLALSLIASAIREAIEGLLRTRSVLLERGIAELLNKQRLMAPLYNHPLIRALYRGPYLEAKRKRRLPSYIPARSFAQAIADLTMRGSAPGSVIRCEAVKGVVHGSLDGSGEGLAQAEVALARWFESSMDRVSGWYRRITIRLLFVIGVVVAAATNVDAVRLARGLYASPVAREALVAAAKAAATDSSVAVRELARLDGLPIGWPDAQWREQKVARVAGWLVTAVAISLGAPFWFDLLNRVMTLRSAVKPDDSRGDAESRSVGHVTEPRGVLLHEWTTGEPQEGTL